MQSIPAGLEVGGGRGVGKDGLAREGRAFRLLRPYTASMYCIHVLHTYTWVGDGLLR